MVTQRPCHMAGVAWVWPWGGHGRNPRTRTEQAGFCDHSQGWPAPAHSPPPAAVSPVRLEPSHAHWFSGGLRPSVRVADWVVSTGTVWPTNPKQYLTLCRRGLWPWTGGWGEGLSFAGLCSVWTWVDLGGPLEQERPGGGWRARPQAGTRLLLLPAIRAGTSELRLPRTGGGPAPPPNPSSTPPIPCPGLCSGVRLICSQPESRRRGWSSCPPPWLPAPSMLPTALACL